MPCRDDESGKNNSFLSHQRVRKQKKKRCFPFFFQGWEGGGRAFLSNRSSLGSAGDFPPKNIRTQLSRCSVAFPTFSMFGQKERGRNLSSSHQQFFGGGKQKRAQKGFLGEPSFCFFLFCFFLCREMREEAEGAGKKNRALIE